MNTPKAEKIYHGNPVSAGAVFGQALKLDSRNRLILKLFIDDSGLDREIERFERAIRASKEQLEALKSRLAQLLGAEHSFIIDVHLLMLEDQSFISGIDHAIRSKHANAEWAVVQISERIRSAYAALEEEYFRDRGADIESVVERILFNLSGDTPLSWSEVPHDVILVTHDISPTAFGTMDLQKVKGLVLESGARTSHTAIIARSLRIPALMGVRDFLSSINSGDPILLDGDEGVLVVHPTSERLEELRRRLDGPVESTDYPEHPPGEPVLTKDGTPVFLRANIELPYEFKTALLCGASGIGLFRTEFIFFAHPHGFPGVEAQYEVYSQLVREMQPHPVSIRTLDVSPEFARSTSPDQQGLNPGMGVRGIRQSLQDCEGFAGQIEAILRAGLSGRIEIVLPMITSVEEVISAKQIIQNVQEAMGNPPALRELAVGGMIEVPSAVLSLEAIAAELDFICVGTNDLIQYLLAVDRGNPQVSHLYQPLHPAVIRALSIISEVCARLNKPVRICGEMSANPVFVSLLLGMGFRDFSMNSYSIPTIGRSIHRINLPDARRVAARAMELHSAREIGEYLIGAAEELIGLDLAPYVHEIREKYRGQGKGASDSDPQGSISLTHRAG